MRRVSICDVWKKVTYPMYPEVLAVTARMGYHATRLCVISLRVTRVRALARDIHNNVAHGEKHSWCE
eukprot:78465-Pleurochrysis_carterae.AAC.1